MNGGSSGGMPPPPPPLPRLFDFLVLAPASFDFLALALKPSADSPDLLPAFSAEVPDGRSLVFGGASFAAPSLTADSEALVPPSLDFPIKQFSIAVIIIS